MGKYEPLGDYLRKQRASHVPMTFAEIERIIGAKLPSSQKYPAWWSNNTSNNVMTQVWLDAGFQTEQVDVANRKLVFRRVKAPAGGGEASAGGETRHPLVGWMKGTVTIAPGVDLTKPADPEWGEVAYGNASWDNKA
jgi:predicted nucleic acid-binding Zn ribbon protein